MTRTKAAGRDHWDWGRQADGLRRQRRWKEALACYNQALRRNPLDIVSRDAYIMDLNAKRQCLRQLGRLAAAARCDEEAKPLRAALGYKKARAGPEAVLNSRLVRAIAALRRDAGPHRRGEFTRALLKSRLLVEESSRSATGFHHRTRSGLVEVFTDLAAYRRWRPRPPAGHALGVRAAADLIAHVIEAREDGIIVNAGGPAKMRLSCKGSAALLLMNRYPIYWV